MPAGLEGVVRVFARCAASPAAPGAVALVFANPQHEAIQLALPVGLRPTPREEYVLTPAPDGSGLPPLQSHAIALNGVRLEMAGPAKVDLPPIKPEVVHAGEIVLPTLSYGFLILPHAHAQACL